MRRKTTTYTPEARKALMTGIVAREPPAQRGLRDADIRRRLRVFALTSSGNMTVWETGQLLISRLAEIEKYAHEHAGHYVVSVTKQGLRRLESGQP